MNLQLTEINFLRSPELTVDESVLVLPAEVGHADLRRVKRHVRVALVEAGLDPDLKRTFPPCVLICPQNFKQGYALFSDKAKFV